MNALSWILVAIGVSGILFGVLYSLFKSNRQRTYLEMLPIMEQRKQDLPQVKQSLAEYIARIEYLAENNSSLYDLEEYKREYFKDGIKGIRKYALLTRPKEAYYWELWQREKVWKDNSIFRQVKAKDYITSESLAKLNYYMPLISDKHLRKYIQAIIKYSHIAYSMVIWLSFGDRIFDAPPKIKNLNTKRKETTLNILHNFFSRANSRIEELLAGAEDT